MVGGIVAYSLLASSTRSVFTTLSRACLSVTDCAVAAEIVIANFIHDELCAE